MSGPADAATRRQLRHADLTAVALRAGRGDPVALDVLVSRTVADVTRYCAHLVGPADADDLAQAAFLRAVRALPRFRGESSARTWLFGIARHACLDEHRARHRRRRLQERLQVASGSEAAADDRLPLELREALAALEPDRREAFVLTQVLGFGYADAAAIVGCPVGTIRSRVSRARVDVAGWLGDEAPTALRPAPTGARAAAATGAAVTGRAGVAGDGC